jgi:hypothetical protein
MNNLTQLVSEPTRIPDRYGDAANTLDLFLTTHPNNYKVNISSPLGSSDHCVITAQSEIVDDRTRTKPQPRTIWQFKNADWDGLRSFYSGAQWPFSDDPSASATGVDDIILEGMNLFIPHKVLLKRPDNPWFDLSCQAACNLKEQKYRSHKSNPTAASLTAYKAARTKAKCTVNRAKKRFFKEKTKSLAEDPNDSKSFWSIVKGLGTNFCSTSIPPLTRSDGTIAFSAQDKANCLGSMFASNSTLEATDLLPPGNPRAVNVTPMGPVRFHTRHVRNVLDHLDSSKAPGPDNIYPMVLKKCAPELSPVLRRLFHLSYSTGIVPSSWKNANVQPIPKKGDASMPNNYRPISLVSVISKVMETVINKQLLSHLERNSLLSDHQFGFRSERSTADLLCLVTDKMYQSLEGHGETNVIAADISKAFDRVWHLGIASKFPSYGIHQSTTIWSKSLLNDRQIRAMVDGTQSDFFKINAGVPQGSVLAPTLFLLHINDLLSIPVDAPEDPFPTLTVSYADDTNLIKSTIYKSSLQASERLQVDRENVVRSLNDNLARISSWGDSNRVQFNATKTDSLVVSRKRIPPQPALVFNGADVKCSSSLNVLGLTIDSRLTWKEHIHGIAAVASRKLGFLFGVRSYFSPTQLLALSHLGRCIRVPPRTSKQDSEKSDKTCRRRQPHFPTCSSRCSSQGGLLISVLQILSRSLC